MKNSNNLQTEELTILSLLPYMENAQLASKKQKMDDLYLTQKIVNLSIIALQFFLNGHLVAFDAQVGENLCQIRAYRILHLAKKWLNNPLMKLEFQKQIDMFLKYQNQLQSVVAEWEVAIETCKSYNKNLDSSENSSSFFARLGLELILNEELAFIIACYFLTHFGIKDNNIPVAINLKQIAQELTISNYRAKRLSRRYQQLVCKAGCNFIMQIAREMPFDEGYLEILPNLYKISDEERVVLPCHIVSEIIFNHAIIEQIPILLKVNRFCASRTTHYDTILFNLVGKGEHEAQFMLIPSDPNHTRHCLVVSGEVQDKERNNRETAKHYIYRLLKETPLKLILANTAIHPQYSGKRLEAFRNNPFQAALSDSRPYNIGTQEKELAFMQNFALEAGCSKQNPTTFFLKHIYANALSNEINELNSIQTGCAYRIIEGKPEISENTGQIYDKKESNSLQPA